MTTTLRRRWRRTTNQHDKPTAAAPLLEALWRGGCRLARNNNISNNDHDHRGHRRPLLYHHYRFTFTLDLHHTNPTLLMMMMTMLWDEKEKKAVVDEPEE
jgi:hypothetical protein